MGRVHDNHSTDPRIARLRAIHGLRSGEEMDEYDELIGQLARDEPLDPALLPDLLLSFFDDTEGHEVMWSLLHHVEDYPGAVYVPNLVQSLSRMALQARQWAMLLLGRVVNSEGDRLLLRKAYRNLPAGEQREVLELLRELSKQAPSVAPAVEEVTGT